MKRLLITVLAMLALAACASPLAKPETPAQAVSAAAQRAGQLKSAKFDMQGHVALTFPAQLGQLFGQGAGGAGSFALDLTGNGEAQFPDRYHATLNAKLGGIGVATEVIVLAGTAYVKDPLTGKWTAAKGAAGFSDQLGQPDPLSYSTLLSSAKSVTEKTNSADSQAGLRHFQIVPDKAKLLSRLSTSTTNAQSQAALKQMLDSGSMLIDVWIGKDDHLVRKLTTHADYTIDLGQLMGTLGAGSSGSTSKLPAGSSIHAVADLTIAYHDFDSPVTITIPTV